MKARLISIMSKPIKDAVVVIVVVFYFFKKLRFKTFLAKKKLFPKKSRPKHFWSKQNSDAKFFFYQQIFQYKTFVGQRNFWVKEVKRYWLQKKVCSKRYLDPKKFCQKNVGPEKLWPQKIVSQTLVSNSWEYADMDKCCQDIC